MNLRHVSGRCITLPTDREIDETELLRVSGELAEKERRKEERRKFLEFDLSFDDMFRQSCARVHFMKTRRNDFHHPTSPRWGLSKTADKYLSRFKYNIGKNRENETLFLAAMRNDRVDDAETYKAEADKYLTKCLHAHYVIGVLYRDFMEGMGPVV